ncbi:MAG TPA: hypothetical protein VHE35_28780 [Kofleriaceae bacterium]|nr:hypothetical protein [Kofleriaceae bacterium]
MSEPGKNRYFIVGIRPVRFRVHDRGMTVEVLDWQTGELVPDGSYLSKALGHGETEEVDEQAFEAALEERRAEIRARQAAG